MKKYFPLIFIFCGLFALLLGALAGVMSSMVYIFPDFMKDYIPFNQLRPLHTSFVVSWIILAAVGGIYFYMSRVEKHPLYSQNLGVAHLIIYLCVAILIPLSVLSKNMGGREYLEFSPFLIIPILIGWFLFGVNYFKTMLRSVRNWPAYYWMWGIGIVFMIFHLSESNFWMIKSIRQDYLRDVTVQWKSYGSFVGSWNMLVYGTAMYLMAKIKDVNIARGKTTFFFMFLGLTNLMFGWAHHTYIIPTAPWVRYFAYFISMTEWIIFIKIVWGWSKSLTIQEKKENSITYKFLMASDVWVFINLFIALLMSIPTFNYFSHGTHITVAHSMGTTIGINTCILFASVAYIIKTLTREELLSKWLRHGFYLLNGSLFVFFTSLTIMGVIKINWRSSGESYAELHGSSHAFYALFMISGIALFCSFVMIAIPMMRKIYPYCLRLLLSKKMVSEIESIEE